MRTTTSSTTNAILKFINDVGGLYSSWYVGIAADPEARLFHDHAVNKDFDKWIYHPTSSSDEAREIELYFINEVGTDGGPGGGSDDTTFVYAYKKNGHTNP